MKLFLATVVIFFSSCVYAGCDDQPSNEVDWTNCNFVENLDLIGVGLANAKMSGVNLSLANLEKSQLNNSDLSVGNFIFANFSNSNLYETNNKVLT
jgi:Pentapeptide repeats (8 copies).